MTVMCIWYVDDLYMTTQPITIVLLHKWHCPSNMPHGYISTGRGLNNLGNTMRIVQAASKGL